MNTPGTSVQPRSNTRAIVMLVIGAALFIVAPVLGVAAGGFAAIPNALGLGDRTVGVTPSGVIDLDAGERLYLLAPVPQLADVVYDDCTVTGPDGGRVEVSFAPASALNTLANGQQYESFAELTATTAGEHEIACTTDRGVPVITAPPFDLGLVFGPLLWWTLGGFAAGLAGVVLVILGIVGLTRGRGGPDATRPMPGGTPLG